MLTTSTALMLAKYNHWADQILFTAIQTTLPPSAVHQTRKTLFQSMLGTLNHNHQVDLIWRAHLLNQEHGFSHRRDLLHPDFGDLFTHQVEINQWYIDWAGQQDQDSLSVRSKFTYVNGTEAEMTRGGMFLHIVHHKTYHRGWVGQMFFDYGVNPPEMDLCVYLCLPVDDGVGMEVEGGV
ncbi:DinB family protein [Aspergillus sclerotiicarbonarius CBS 121057]|uniref:DinB family protein n=1 Tax=Aspergillus sclerotiicarbonarius (strain CBS 121057 / IBT 28362) TaxID=1448318 RepID=A0A319DWB7_ASPSB|nr:DinB family protein [Aspergillus sclerotiicarbonarius CBS 121057]